MSTYPTGIPSFTTVSSTDTLAAGSHSNLHNQLAIEIAAIATELGVNASGSFPTVRDRLESLELGTSSEATLDNIDTATATVGNLSITTLSGGALNVSSITTSTLKVASAIANLTVTSLQATTLTGVTYIATAGNATYSTIAGSATISTYSTVAGNATYSTVAGNATFSTVASSATTAAYSTVAGIATTASIAITLTANSVLSSVIITSASITNLTVGALSGYTPFGNWTTSGLANMTAYLAPSDGFVVGTMLVRQNHGYVYTDASNPPTTAIVDLFSWDGVFTDAFCVPVKKGHYWKVASITEGGSWASMPIINWIPSGT